MRYPTTENEQLALAMNIVKGLTDHTDIYPTPPILPAALQALIDTYLDKRDASDTLAMQTRQANLDEAVALEAINAANKSDLRYAENTVNNNNEKLKLLSWGAPAPPTKMQIPGASRALEIVRQGNDWIFLDWKEPADGGKVASYKIMRSENGGESWTEAGSNILSEYTLYNQPANKPLLYQVVAMNRAGLGMPSNAISVTL